MAHGILICLGAFAYVALAQSPGTGSAGYAMEEMRAELASAFISGELGITEMTIKTHRGRVMRKMQAASLADLVRMAKVGASAYLIGESFMRKPDVEQAVRDILRKAA